MASTTTTTDQTDEDRGRLYSILNVSKDHPDIPKHAKFLLRVYHPDKNRLQQDDAQRSFVNIKLASDILSDRIYKLVYDHYGLSGVQMVKRSQVASSSNNTEDTIDFYTLLADCKSDQEALQLLQQVVDEQKGQRSAKLELSANVPCMFQKQTLHQTGVSLNATSKVTFDQATVSLTATSDLDSQGSTTKPSLSVDWHPVRGTHIVSSLAVTVPTGAPVVSLRTSRNTATGSILIMGLGGNWESQNLFLRSFRTISNYFVSWGMDVSRAGVRFVMLSVRTITHPMLCARLSLAHYPLKVSYTTKSNDGDNDNGTYVSYSWGLNNIYKIKVLHSTRLGEFRLRYGLKYDAKALYIKDVPWVFIVHIHASNMHIKIPIKLVTVSPIAWLITFLLSDFFEQQIEAFSKSWEPASNDNKSTNRSPNDTKQSSLQFLNSVRAVASTKRKRDKLVITKAILAPGNNVADVLQFWVHGSSLRLRKDDARWNWIQKEPSTKLPWWKQWLGFQEEEPAPMTVRYQIHGSVFEFVYDWKSDLQLPAPAAAKLGDASLLQ